MNSGTVSQRCAKKHHPVQSDSRAVQGGTDLSKRVRKP
jgi:hypothetical protein